MKVITLDQDCGIKRIRELCEEANQAAAEEPVCAVDVSRVQRIDLSVGQVLLALQEECLRRGGACEVRNANETVSRLLAYVGIDVTAPAAEASGGN